MKKFLISILFIATCFGAFAQSSKIKRDDSKIIVVGRINVFYDENRDFIFQTRGLEKTYAEKPDTYTVPYIKDPNDTFGNNASKYFKENQYEYPIGDIFMVSYKRPKKGENVLHYRSNFNMYFYSSTKAHIYLPMVDFDIDIPDGVEALYLGTFNYYVTGDNFTIDSFERVDEYDLAQEELDRCLGTHVDMARAVIKVIEEETKDDSEIDAK